ncbi:MAG: response regulator [Rhodospirillales bacterium]|nr:response regulator [Rhodospirillales bacterium]
MNRVAIISGDDTFRGQLVSVLGSYYHVFPFSDHSEALDGLRTLQPDATLLDIHLGKGGGLKLLREVRANALLKKLQVVVVTDNTKPALSDEIKYSGADDVLVKPFRKSFLLKAVTQMINSKVEKGWDELPQLQQRALKETAGVFRNCFADADHDNPLPMDQIEKSCAPLIEAISDNQIGGILQGVQGHDDYTYVHSLRVSIYLSLLGHAMGIRGDDMMILSSGGLMHDIGKARVPLGILNKPGRLTEEEWPKMSAHVLHTSKILNNTETIHPGIRIIAEQHHEKLDGTGYPYGLKGKDLNSLARMASIVDIYGALTDERVYKKAMPAEKAISILMEMENELDMGMLKVFQELLLDNTTPYEKVEAE